MEAVDAHDMTDQPVAVRACPMAASLDVLGERWTLLAIREMTYGVHRFGQIAGYTGASRDILADRLRKLESAGVVERRLYSEHPPRYEYHLTEAGEDLQSTLLGLFQWGERWTSSGPTVAIRHSCGHDLQVAQICEHCGERISRKSIEFKAVDHCQ
ncbi:winged helix-turn-helix transcriptional regulator [Streptomyces sp. SAS_275]|uniref:winged helix-turn-helix transcriptional regulator n=1 Tax=Streptomyces sp. SAS_275 TaxID=3412746 RepID=UPI00403CC256